MTLDIISVHKNLNIGLNLKHIFNILEFPVHLSSKPDRAELIWFPVGPYVTNGNKVGEGTTMTSIFIFYQSSVLPMQNHLKMSPRQRSIASCLLTFYYILSSYRSIAYWVQYIAKFSQFQIGSETSSSFIV